mgnify:CR=1 FL=1
MLMNFNFTNNKCAQSFLTADETEILVQSSKLDKEYEQEVTRINKLLDVESK